MIKFFRKIRQRLLSENKFSKYLLYALGEIVLVVIGILIALQLNIKNEERKAHERNVDLLHKLSQEARLNVGRVDTLLSYSFPFFFEHADSIRNILNHGFEEPDLKYILSKDIWYYNAFNLNKTTFEQIKNTGALYTLGTDSLITEIELYYQLCDRGSQYNEIYAKDVVTDRSRCAHGWTYLEMEMRTGSENVEELSSWLHDPDSKDYRNFKLFISKVCYHSYFMTGKLKRIRAESENLIASIEDELEQIE